MNIRIVVSLLLASLLIAACGGRTNVPTSPSVGASAPTPTPTPSPTPVPRQTISLSAPTDTRRTSPYLLALAQNQAFEITFSPDRVNDSSNRQFGIAVEFWLESRDLLSDRDIGFDLTWIRGGTQWVSQVFSDGAFNFLSPRISMPLGTQHLARLERGRDRSELFVDGISMGAVADADLSRLVYVAVYGADATFSFVASPTASSPKAGSSPAAMLPPPRR